MTRFSVSHIGRPDEDARSLTEAQDIVKRKRGKLSTWGPWRKEKYFGRQIEWRRADWITSGGQFGGAVVEQREVGADLKRAKRRVSKRSKSKRGFRRRRAMKSRNRRVRMAVRRRRVMSLPKVSAGNWNATLKSMSVGATLDLPHGGYVKKKKSNDFVLVDKKNQNRSRWGNSSEIAEDVQFFVDHGHLPAPSGGIW